MFGLSPWGDKPFGALPLQQGAVAHQITASNSTQANASTSGAISFTPSVTLTGAGAAQANASTDSAIAQAHRLTASNASQASTSSAGAIGDGSIVWPATRAGDSHTAVVPHTGLRVIVPDGDDATAPPVKAFTLYSADAQTYLVDFESKYLAGAKDLAAQFMGAWADAGVSVAPAMAPGAVLSHGVIPVTVTPGGTEGNYSIYVQIRTVGGRERVAPFIVQVTAVLQPVKRFRLRTVDRDVYDLNFALRHLAGMGDAAAGLLGVQAPAGVEVQGNLVGGVVQIAVDNPAAAGSYLISAQISTTSGDRKTAAIVVEVAP